MGNKEQISRRHFMATLAVSGAWAGWVGCATVPVYRAALEQNRLMLDLKTLDALLQEKNACVVQAEGLPEPLLIIRTGPEQYNVLGSTCTHLGCQVRPGRGFINCPCHGSTFALDGQVVRGPAPKPLTQYRFTVQESSMEIWLN